MKQGFLSQYFAGVALKRLSAVEASPARSNQHEFNGVKELKRILGESDGPIQFPSKFLYLTDDEDRPTVEEGLLTWYDSRQKARLERGVNRSEYRLYFPSNLVTGKAAEGDLLVIARLQDNSLLTVVAQRGTTMERQILWLFSAGELNAPGFAVKDELESERDRLGFAAKMVLEQIGVELEAEAANYLEEMLFRFEGAFPKTAEFSGYARSTLRDVDSRENPDIALVVWMEHEEALFRTLEKHLIGEKLKALAQAGFGDTDAVIKIVQSALQRRKSRAGAALENHLEQVFRDHQITYSRTPVTENSLKPDFIFPSISHYRDRTFDAARLTMLAAKSTCKDRWRQILNEAARVPNKHLLTLEPSISLGQTAEMQAERVQLVLPESLHATYAPSQRAWLMDVKGFIGIAQNKQQRV